MTMFNGSPEYHWDSIIEDYKEKVTQNQVVSNPEGIFNMCFVDQNDYSRHHRSGWQYVYNSIKCLHNDDSNLMLDLYLDRTFHWNLEVNKYIGIVPYKRNWIGFIHHTFDESFSIHNVKNMLKVPEFIESLRYCKGLIVLSKHTKDKILEIYKDKLSGIPIYVMYHPTELNVKSFSYNKFMENDNKKLVHIGAWLRNIYSFYQLELNDFEYIPFIGNKKTYPITETCNYWETYGKLLSK